MNKLGSKRKMEPRGFLYQILIHKINQNNFFYLEILKFQKFAKYLGHGETLFERPQKYKLFSPVYMREIQLPLRISPTFHLSIGSFFLP